MKRKKEQQLFNDWLFPIVVTIILVPVIIRLIIYDCDLSGFTWFSQDGLVSDFFSYYKSYLFILIIVVVFFALIPRMFLYKNNNKNWKFFIPLGIYGIFTILSAIKSVNPNFSFEGNYYIFESVIILIGYCIISFYTYQVVEKERDFKIIVKAFIILTIILCIVGLSQLFKADFIQSEWLQRFIISERYRSQGFGNAENILSKGTIYLTLFNPNHASMYIAMMVPFFLVLYFYEREKTKKSIYISINIVLIILQFKTYSRTGFFSLLISLIFLCFFCKEKILLNRKKIVLFFMLMLAGFILVDALNQFRFLTKFADTLKSFQLNEHTKKLEQIVTDKNNVLITYRGRTVRVALREEVSDSFLIFFTEDSKDITGFYNNDSSTLNMKGFEDVQFSVLSLDNRTYISFIEEDTEWLFTYDEKDGYIYLNDWGRFDKISPVNSLGSDNMGHLASGRFYIWSRTIPLLKNYIFIGSGPNTFPLVYPQNDYVGKANFCKTPTTVIDKPHNMYLMTGVQTGVISLICVLIFFGVYIVNSIKIYSKCKFENYTQIVGLACFLSSVSYMASGVFNDSSVQVSPIFWILMGMGMAANNLQC